MRIIYKILIISLVCLSIISINCTTYALDGVIRDAQKFLKDGEEQPVMLKGDAVEDASSKLYGMLLGVGTITVIIATAFIGTKFIISSAEEKADLKQAILPFIIGAFVIFGAFGIWRILVTLLSALENI